MVITTSLTSLSLVMLLPSFAEKFENLCYYRQYVLYRNVLTDLTAVYILQYIDDYVGSCIWRSVYRRVFFPVN